MSKEKRDAIKKKCEKLAEFLTETNDILGDTCLANLNNGHLKTARI